MNDIQKLIEAVEAGAVISLNAKDVCVFLWDGSSQTCAQNISSLPK